LAAVAVAMALHLPSLRPSEPQRGRWPTGLKNRFARDGNGDSAGIQGLRSGKVDGFHGVAETSSSYAARWRRDGPPVDDALTRSFCKASRTDAK
jgi:hypothetical protein